MSPSCAQGDADVVEALEEPVPGGVVERERRPRARCAGRRQRAGRSTSMVISRVGSASTASQQRLGRPRRVDLDGHEAVLGAVVAEDVGEARRDDGLEAVVHDRPDGVLARRAGAEVGAGDEDGGARRSCSWLSTKSRSSRHSENRPGAEAGALDPLEPVARDDLVGVDVGAVERDGGAGDDDDGFHGSSGSSVAGRSGVAKVPAMAVAAATAGETRWVRPPRPWRPSKLRLLVRGARARRRPACRGSWPGTSSSPARASRSRRRGRSRRGPRPRPAP